MTTQSNKKVKDNSFSSFAIGVSVGVVASFLFGTEEGRNLVKRVVDTIPDKYKKIPQPIKKVMEDISPPRQNFTPVIEPQETPHHAIYNNREESPPPPPPVVHPLRPDSFY